MDIEAAFAKAIQPYETRMQELVEAEKRKENEIKELKDAIIEMIKIVKEYRTQQVAPIPPKGKPEAKPNNQARPQTAVLPNRPSKPESFNKII